MGLFRFVDFEHCIGIVLLTLLFALASSRAVATRTEVQSTAARTKRI